ncbi:MAG TPA: DUF58 domain-containing protein [Gaiellales bacterium]
MITPRGVAPFGIAALLTLLAAPAGASGPVFLVATLVALAVVGWDWRQARATPLEVERVASGPFSVGRANLVQLVVRTPARRLVVVRIADGPPENSDLWPLDHQLTVTDADELVLELELVPRRRGPTVFPAAGARVLGPHGLAFSQRRFPATAVAAVTWPDVLQLRDERLLPSGRRAGGMRQARVGDRGREFESLRAYVQGDEYRRISWKATARRGSPVVVNTQPERRQSLILALETGRLMAGGGGDGLGKLDRAINAGVMLSAAAREFDDAVGALSFDQRARRALLPQARVGQVRRVVETLAPLEAGLVEPDWPRGLAAIARLGTRRSLVVLFSDLHYVETDPGLAVRLGTLARRHVVLFASTVDHALSEQAAVPVADEETLYRRGTATALLERRQRAAAELERRGVHTLDAAPADLTAAVVTRFRLIRRQGLV